MKKYLLGATAGFVCVAATIVPGTAATLDDVMARLDSLQRDNQAMRKEIAALRQREQRSTAVQAAAPRNAPRRPLAPAASSAMAADFPVKSGYVEPRRAFSWSGFYMGVHGGYGWGSSDWDVTNTPPPATANPRSRGFLGGIQGGANHQFGNWVAGIEADFSLIDADATSTAPLGAIDTATAHSEIDWLATFTGRFGYAFDHSLLYVKGGVAGAEFKDSYMITVPGVGLFDLGTQSHTRVGWTAGAGFEYAILSNWTAKIEYNYLDFGSKDETFVLSNGVPFNQSIERKLQLVKVGINYKFGEDSH
jgi:outer membrane immunogenic protein